MGEREGDRKRQTEKNSKRKEGHREREGGYEEMKTISFKNRVPWLWFGSRISGCALSSGGDCPAMGVQKDILVKRVQREP